MIVFGKRVRHERLPAYILFRGKRYYRGAHFCTRIEAHVEMVSLRKRGVPARLYADGLTVYHKKSPKA